MSSEARQDGPPRGVNIIGWMSMQAGLATACRMNAWAIKEAGFETVENDFPHGLLHPNKCTVRYDTNYFHFQPDHWTFPTDLLEKLMEGRRNIAYWAWETSKVPPLYLEWTKKLDQVWVPSTFVKEALAGAHCPVHVVPHAVDVPKMGDDSKRPSTFRVLFSFDGKSSVVRKNPFAVVRAFQKAFPGADEDVQLVIKTHALCPEMEDALDTIESMDRRIQVVHGYVSEDWLAHIYDTCHVFLSLHRGEGFGLHLAEAMARGLVVIATNWGGSLDLLKKPGAEIIADQNCILVASSPIKVADGYYGRHESEWAEPNVAHAAAVLQATRDHWGNDGLKFMRMSARRRITEHFSRERLVNRIKELLA